MKDNDRYIEYDEEVAIVAARTIDSINHEVSQKGSSFAQQYILHKGLKKYGQKGVEAATAELDQLHKRNCFTPIDVSALITVKKEQWSRFYF